MAASPIARARARCVAAVYSRPVRKVPAKRSDAAAATANEGKRHGETGHQIPPTTRSIIAGSMAQPERVHHDRTCPAWGSSDEPETGVLPIMLAAVAAGPPGAVPETGPPWPASLEESGGTHRVKAEPIDRGW